MIQVRTENGDVKLMSNYHQVCDYINRMERKKASETGKVEWLFTRRSFETLANLYYRTSLVDKNFFTPKEKEAIEKEVGVVEILKGSMENFMQILSRSTLDIEPIKKSWCNEYCMAHGLEICELVEKPI